MTETTSDAYYRSGEFLDVLSLDAWEHLGGPVRAALQGAPRELPIADLGAGSGLGVLVAARALPGAEIVAVEPSIVQRAALLARVGTDRELRQCVTVVAADAQTAELPERLGAALAINMIGHLAPDARRALWHRLADRLAAGAPLVVNAQPPAEAVTVPESEFAAVRVGRHTYRGSGSAEPVSDGEVAWHMRYQITDDQGRTVRDLRVTYRWHVVSVAALSDELAEAGFTVTAGPLDVLRAVR
ncbi:trans-aconitate 2-methyltransferase [Micromonospora sp. ATCC 39149]|uniref:Class I SAM-dependent methyltransferase n=1 Tax=Micromonospora carbonacea TaxID=47853 RepID=A0A7D5YD70_9ACTN|nr:class I SAM-dependent methyltransferase [Micromonospora sp. ATCC 39149]QLJ96796.1 class I SAM-dependent methyltransferase [Micromonospora carbonacea]